MKYLVLIAGDETLWDRMSEAEQQAELAAFDAFGDAVKAGGAVLAGEALAPSTVATTVRRVDGRTVLHDGPFAETVEQIGGFWLLESTDFDALTEACRLLPGHYAYEIRPVVEIG